MPDWQLPPGVSRSLWEQSRDTAIARGYDAALEATPLLKVDLAFFQAHCPTPGRLLDLGAGTGRLAIPMAKAGHWVVAVDLSAPMLERLGEKARQEGAQVHCVNANIVNLAAMAGETFDYVACLFGTLGLVEGHQHRQRVLSEARRLLRPGGVLILHVHNRWVHLGTRFGRRLLLRNWWRALWGRERPGDFVQPPHQGIGSVTMHLFTLREVKGMLRSAGLVPMELKAISHGEGGRLCCPWLLPRLRCYGYLIAARRGVEWR